MSVEESRLPATAVQRQSQLMRLVRELVALLLGTVLNDRPQFLIMTTRGLSKQGVHAGNLVREVGKAAGGGGGGGPETAQAGGRDPATRGLDPDMLADLEKQFGFDKPLHERFLP